MLADKNHWDSGRTSGRVLAVMRLPAGGVRAHILYGYPARVPAGYPFTFVGPADESFRAFGEEIRGWQGAEFVEAHMHGRQCRLWPTVRGLLRSGHFDLVHSDGLTAGAQVVWANLGVGVPHV